jgi:CheY-like chemotaxis protein/HPt (histidine-containing phosphotransfer) domain-containing protein
MAPLNILVIDDDELSRDLLALLLTREGHTVEIAGSGEAAITALDGTAAMPYLVLVDLQMPGLSGNVLAHRLRELCPDTTRVLAMSASTPPGDPLAAFDGFLRKPFNVNLLYASLEQKSSASQDRESPKNSPALDLNTYHKLESAMSAEKLRQLYALCLNDVERRVALMRVAAEKNDDDTYRREAHAIKGGCGLVGALELQSIAANEEKLGITANHVATLSEIPLACKRLEGMLIANTKTLEAEPARSHA